MANSIDMTPTFLRKSNLPVGLYNEPEFELKEEIQTIRQEIVSHTYNHKIMVFSGLNRGKTVSAAALLRDWIATQKDAVNASIPGYFLSVHQLCYQNRTVDRYNRDEGLQEVLRIVQRTDFLVLDGLFTYLTQNDDLLLQSIYDSRQHSGKTTIVTTNIENPLDCAGSILFRISRDANVKVVF